MKKLKRPYPRCFYSSDFAYLMNHRTHRPSQLVYDCEFCSKDCDYRINESFFTDDKGLGMTAEDGVNMGAYISKDFEGDKKSAVQTLIDDLTEKLENDPIKYMEIVQKFRIGDYKVETFVTGEIVIKITISNDDIYKFFYKEDTNS